MTAVRAILVEDEPLARQSLREYAADVDWLAIVAEAADGLEAVKLIDRLEPDLVFLDVTLPELSGLEVLERIRHAPEVVFTTAQDRFAVAAFEAGALDYLLKPFGRQRFRTTVDRVRKRLARPAGQRLFARTARGIVPVQVGAIRRAEASGDYVEVHTDAGSHLLHMTLAELEARLDPERFCRVHRSHLVNLDAVERMSGHDDERRLVVRMRDGTEIVASRAASEQLRRLVR